MMGPPPAPPPPPSLRPPTNPPKNKRVRSSNMRQSAAVGAMEEVRFAAKMLRGHLSHKMNNFREEDVFVCYYNWIPSRIQDGPTCGLVALEIASKLYMFKRSVSIDDIVKLAQEKQFTKQGEMFSAVHMAELVEEICGCRTSVLHDGLNNQHLILEHLLNGGVILIPYDIDHDFRPCCKNGKKAHWAIITGFLVSMPSACCDTPRVKQDEQETYLRHVGSPAMKNILQKHEKGFSDIFLCGKHGKSRHLGLWSYEHMKGSNQNLFELNPDIADNLSDYIVPLEGGHLSGLRGKVVTLFPEDKNS